MNVPKKVSVVKIGGHVLDRSSELDEFLDVFVRLSGHRVLVHGGGKKATEVSRSLGIETQMIDGRRVTCEETLEVVTMVYGGLVNKNLIAHLQAKGCSALGLTGADGDIIRARRRTGWDRDYGFVGDIESVRGEVLAQLIGGGLTPVMAPLTHDGQGTLLNTNADTIASTVARALADHFDVDLIYCFERPGVLENPDDDTSIIREITPSSYRSLRDRKVVAAGMIPKLDNAFAALEGGVREVRICRAGDIAAGGGTKILFD